MALAPGYTHWLPLPYGAFGAILRDPLGFQLRARARFGDVIRFRNGPILIHFLYHPDHVRRVLVERQRTYQRGWQYRLLKRLFGDNLVVSEGAHWRRQRRLAQPAFHRDRLPTYAAVMIDAASQLVESWQGLAAAGHSVDAEPEMSRLALGIAGRTFFSRDVDRESDAVGREFGIVAHSLEQWFNSPFTSPPVWVPTRANRRFRLARRRLNEIVASMIRERRQEGHDRGDLLSMLIAARDEETGEQMTDEQLRCEVLTFLIAGHETTATALTWTLYLLASHPAVQQRVRDEITQVVGDRALSFHGIGSLTTTRRVIEESMRIYPPVWAVSREAVEEDEIAGFRIPARSMIIVCPYVTHRHPDVWERPDEFDPERFTDERIAQRLKGAYFPFLMGPHACIGGDFAMLELQIAIATIVRSFRLERASDAAVEPRVSLTLRPGQPVRLTLACIDPPASRVG